MESVVKSDEEVKLCLGRMEQRAWKGHFVVKYIEDACLKRLVGWGEWKSDGSWRVCLAQT